MKLSMCQWIEGQPTRQEIRLRGSDHFKCGAPVVEGKPYCEPHCARAYIRPIVANDTEAKAESA